MSRITGVGVSRTLLAALPLTVLLIVPAIGEPVMTPKLVVFAILVAAALVQFSHPSRGRLALPPTPYGIAVTLFLLLFAIATVASPDPWASLFGGRGRFDGLVLYGPAAAAGLMMAANATTPVAGTAVRVLGGTGLLLAALVGLDALADGRLFGQVSELSAPIDATLGNPNFAAAYLGAVAPAVAAVALRPRQTRAVRLGAGAGAALVVLAAVLTRSAQGPIVAIVGLLLTAALWASTRPQAQRRITLGVIAVCGAVAFIPIGLGIAGQGPFSAIGGVGAVEARIQFWRTAGTLIGEDPLTGVGPGRFALEAAAARPAEMARLVTVADQLDAAHNVPLHLAAVGGLPLALAYLAVLGVVGLAVVRGYRSTSGVVRWDFATCAIVWLCGVAQSLISIDVVPLVALTWILGGLLAGMGLAERRRVLPVSAAVRRSLQGASVVVAALCVGLTLLPWTAEARVAAASTALMSGDADAAARSAMRARDIGHWDPYYAFLVGRTLTDHDPMAAVQAYQEAVQAWPRHLPSSLSGARVAKGIGDWEQAEALYEAALTADPRHPDVSFEVAVFYAERGDEQLARQFAEDALALDPGHEARELLGALQ